MGKKSKKQSSKPNKSISKKSSEKILYEELFTYATGAYLFMILAVFPLYVRDRFVYLAAYKVVFYRNISLLFLGIAVILVIVGIVLKKKIGSSGFFAKVWKTRGLLDAFVIAYGLWNVVSFLTCSYKSDAIRGFGGWEMGLITQGLMVFGYFFVRIGWDKGKSVWYYAAAALIAESILVVLNRTGNDPLGFYKGLDWFSWSRRNLLGTIGNINWLCGYLVCLLPVLIYLYVFSKIFWVRTLWGIGLYLAFAAIFLQGSRSGILALGAGLLALLFILSDTLEHITRYLQILFCICIFWTQMTLFRVDLIEPMHLDTPNTVYSPLWYIPTVILLAAIIVLNLRLKKGDKILPKGLSLTLRIIPIALAGGALLIFLLCQVSDSVWNLLGAKGLLRFSDEWGSYRGILWKESLKNYFSGNVKDFLFGIGPDCYGPWYTDLGMVITQSGEYEDSMFSNAHNEWITMLIELGFPGLFLYMGIFASAFAAFGKKIRKNPVAFIGFLTVLLYFVNQFFSFQQICVTPIFFVLLALGEKGVREGE